MSMRSNFDRHGSTSNHPAGLSPSLEWFPLPDRDGQTGPAGITRQVGPPAGSAARAAADSLTSTRHSAIGQQEAL